MEKRKKVEGRGRVEEKKGRGVGRELLKGRRRWGRERWAQGGGGGTPGRGERSLSCKHDLTPADSGANYMELVWDNISSINNESRPISDTVVSRGLLLAEGSIL